MTSSASAEALATVRASATVIRHHPSRLLAAGGDTWWDGLDVEDVVGCLVCDRHSGAVDVPGGPIYEDDLVFVGHAFIPDGSDRVYLGWLLVEPKRHVPGLGDLRPDEAERVGALQSLAARALVEAVSAEHVYAFVLGHHVPHLHVHVLPRHPGTPRQYWGTRVDEWPDAPTGDHATITELAARLRTALADWR